MKKRKKRGILCAIGAALFAVAIPQMDSPEPAEIVVADVIVLVLAFVAVRSLFPNLRLRKKSKAAAAPQQTACGCPCAEATGSSEAGLPAG